MELTIKKRQSSRVGASKLCDLDFADDIVLMSDTVQQAQQLQEELQCSTTLPSRRWSRKPVESTGTLWTPPSVATKRSDHGHTFTCGPTKPECFLSRAIAVPDTVAQHLMRFGDVESNPGPVTRAKDKAKHMEGNRDADAMTLCADWYNNAVREAERVVQPDVAARDVEACTEWQRGIDREATSGAETEEAADNVEQAS